MRSPLRSHVWSCHLQFSVVFSHFSFLDFMSVFLLFLVIFVIDVTFFAQINKFFVSSNCCMHTIFNVGDSSSSSYSSYMQSANIISQMYGLVHRHLFPPSMFHISEVLLCSVFERYISILSGRLLKYLFIRLDFCCRVWFYQEIYLSGILFVIIYIYICLNWNFSVFVIKIEITICLF